MEQILVYRPGLYIGNFLLTVQSSASKSQLLKMNIKATQLVRVVFQQSLQDLYKLKWNYCYQLYIESITMILHGMQSNGEKC